MSNGPRVPMRSHSAIQPTVTLASARSLAASRTSNGSCPYRESPLLRIVLGMRPLHGKISDSKAPADSKSLLSKDAFSISEYTAVHVRYDGDSSRGLVFGLLMRLVCNGDAGRQLVER
jgi:hypothetical protein